MTSAPPSNSAIPARSRQQALDWSLVLLSQGVESVIEEAENGWFLLVAPELHSLAVRVLRQYQLENRGWGWRQKMPWPEITFHWGALFWCCLLVFFYWLNSVKGSRLEYAGTMNDSVVQNEAWWRFFTATMLHADLAHLMANIAFGFPILGLAMGRYGAGCAWLAATLAGAAGNVFALAIRSHPYQGLGASGVVMGGLGLLAIQTLPIRLKSHKTWKYIIVGLLGGGLLFTLFGLNPSSDVLAHLGGFIGGLLLGAAMAFVPQKILLSQPANFVCGTLLAGLISLTWILALNHSAPVP